MRTITATANHSKRTFTLRNYYDGVLLSKYRTVCLPKDEFEACLHNQAEDWEHFLKSNDYYVIK